MRRLLAAAALALAVQAPLLRAGDLPADVRPSALREVGFDQRLGENVPADLVLRDEDGRAVELRAYLGRRPVVLSIVYYECPMLCTLTLNGLVSAMATLSFDVGREFEVVTVSFDAREGPELARAKKAAYLQRYKRPGAALGWHFLTGDAEALRALTAAVGFRYAWDERTNQFAHPAGVVVLTPEGRISRYLYGVEYAPKDLRLALVESGEGRIGSAVDQVLLFCYQYDPENGRYGAVIMRLVRLGAVLTLAALGGLIFTLRRAERRTGGPRLRAVKVEEPR
ncbi:MAG TPA: SCO family protein [Longimicrobiales bacterium]|nr:SCO family protein [Longimicrobiales bacterium]